MINMILVKVTRLEALSYYISVLVDPTQYFGVVYRQRTCRSDLPRVLVQGLKSEISMDTD